MPQSQSFALSKSQDSVVTPERLRLHVEMLTQRVYMADTTLPQFRRLIEDVQKLADELPDGAVVVGLERTLVYGGISLFAPIFHRQDYRSIECSPYSAEERGAYNKTAVDDDRCIRIPYTMRGQPEATGLPDSVADLLIIPNLVHHVADQRGMFAETARILKPGGRGYIFEPLVRELHQFPDDYVRYAPSGFERMLAEAGLTYDGFEPEGGPFTAVAYCWLVALEYLPPSERAQVSAWFHDEHLPQLKDWDERYRDNLVRKHTTFPTAFGVHFHKPA